jgi:uncharacterized membrane protein
MGSAEAGIRAGGADAVRRDDDAGSTCRFLSIVGGGWLAYQGLKRPNLVGLALFLAGTGVVLGRDRSKSILSAVMGDDAGSARPRRATRTAAPIHVDERVIIARPRAEVYRFLRDPTNLPHFMQHIQSVTVLSPSRSHWVMSGPAGARMEWDSLIDSERENERIGWRSVDGADIRHSGVVTLADAPDGKGTELRVRLTYEAPFGRAVAELLGEEPELRARADLQRLRQTMEAQDPGMQATTL